MGQIRPAVRAAMSSLEARDTVDRSDGTPRAQRLRAIRPEVGAFLLTLALASRSRTMVEIGTSAGYSTLWLAAAAEHTDGRVITFEIDPAKVELARATFAAAEVDDRVELRATDGGVGLVSLAGIADLVFLDAEKEDYLRLLRAGHRGAAPERPARRRQPHLARGRPRRIPRARPGRSTPARPGGADRAWRAGRRPRLTCTQGRACAPPLTDQTDWEAVFTRHRDTFYGTKRSISNGSFHSQGLSTPVDMNLPSGHCGGRESSVAHQPPLSRSN